jgi:hypothetical protein
MDNVQKHNSCIFQNRQAGNELMKFWGSIHAIQKKEADKRKYDTQM